MSVFEGNTRDLETAVADARSEFVEVPVCRNCDTERSGEFCSGCGQRFLQERLTLRALWRHGVRQLFNVERGLLRTLREMFIDPGGVARRYVNGRRRRYLNPFTYLILCSAIFLILYRVAEKLGGIEFRDLVRASDMPPELAKGIAEFYTWTIENTAWTWLATCVPFALLLRLFFRRSKVNLAETSVLSLFALGQSALVAGLIYVLMLLWPSGRYDSTTASLLSSLALVAICMQAVLGFFGKSFFNVLRSLVAILLAYTGYMGLLLAVMLGFMWRHPTLMQGAQAEPTLFQAAAENDAELVWTLLEEGVDVNRPRADTALHLAAANGHLEIVNLLLAHGADLQALDHQGHSAVSRAIRQRRRDVAITLIERGAEVNQSLADGTTLLMMAASRSTRVTEALLEAGAEVDATRDHRLATALMVAAEDAGPGRVEALLEHGADPHLVNRDGDTALQVAEKALGDMNVAERSQARAVMEILQQASSQ